MSDISMRGQDIVNQIKNITRLLAVGATVAVAMIIAKITASDEKLKLPGDIKLSAADAWVVLAVLTACHVFLTIFLIRQMHLVWRDPATVEEGTEIVKAVKADGNIFVSGLEVSVEKRRGLYIRSAWDQSIWIAYLTAFLLIAALLPWDINHGHLHWSSAAVIGIFIAVAVVSAALNWVAGGTWVVALIELSLPKAQATYHQRLDHLYYSGREIPINDVPPPDEPK